MPKTFFDNTVMKKLRNGEPVSATWSQLGSARCTEILAEAGFDVIVIDMEHSQLTLPDLTTMMMAMKGTDAIPIVRAPWNDMVWCKQILDCGAYGIHIPYVSTKEEAEYAVKSCKYALEGFRGIASTHRAVDYGLKKKEYWARANDDIIVMIAIETPEGVANIDEIASVKGVDGIFIGPSDLSTSMGHFVTPSHPEVQDAIRKVEKSAKAHGKFLGTIAADMEAAKALYDRGYSIVYFMSDAVSLGNMAAKQVAGFNEYMSARTEKEDKNV